VTDNPNRGPVDHPPYELVSQSALDEKAAAAGRRLSDAWSEHQQTVAEVRERVREHGARAVGELGLAAGLSVVNTEARVHATNAHFDEARQELAIQHSQLEHPDQPDHTVIIEADPADEGPEPLGSYEWGAVAEVSQNALEEMSGVDEKDD
jgi:hypothetical protein